MACNSPPGMHSTRIRPFADVVALIPLFSLGYRAGVTLGVSSPFHSGVLSGLSAAFGLGSSHKLEPGAVVASEAAVHVSIGHSVASGSVSTQVAALRRLVFEPPPGDTGRYFKQVANVWESLTWRNYHFCEHTSNRVRERSWCTQKAQTLSLRFCNSRKKLRDRKSTCLNSSHSGESRMPSSA